MEIPIQVACHVCPCYPNEPCCVQTIPHYIDTNANNLSLVPLNGPTSNNEHLNTGLVEIASFENSSDVENGNDSRKSFAIQHALPFGCSQEFLYRKTVLPMIGNFLEGFDASIITYGQHGTGKTYTMFGPGADCTYNESKQGIVQRAVRDIFTNLAKRQRNSRFSVNVAWIEVCGNEIHDILGGSIVQCQNIDDVFQCLQIGMVNRGQEASHSLFTITLEQQWITANGLIQHRLSTASFCDSSGTERMLSLDHFNQQISVPKDIGLQALERIVMALSNPNLDALDNGNINLMNIYEETMLTKLLKDSIGGRAQTLILLCVSPLEQDICETTQNLEFAYKAQSVKNIVIMNTFSDNNLPIANFIDPMMVPTQNTISMPVPLPQALHYDQMSVMNKINATNNPTNMGMKFAATQWLKLVSNAEGLFSKLLVNNKSLDDQERECIEEWMDLKQECEECLNSADLAMNPRLLGPIQETDEPDDNSGSEDGTRTPDAMGQEKIDAEFNETTKSNRFVSRMESTENTTLTDNESDSEDNMQQSEYLKERVAELMIHFSNKTNEMFDENYDEFIKAYPKAVTHSYESKTEDLPCVVKTKRSSSVVIANEPTVNMMKGRRKSIQPGDSNTDALMLSRTDLEHLQRMADEGIRNSQSLNLNKSVCREVAEFLESSNDMHPIRAANASRKQKRVLHDICKMTNSIAAKKKLIEELQQNIKAIEKLIHEQETSNRLESKIQLEKIEKSLLKDKAEYKKRIKCVDLHEKKMTRKKLEECEKQLDELHGMKKLSQASDNDVKRNQHDYQQRRAELKELQTSLKNDEGKLKKLEIRYEELFNKDDKKLYINNVDTRITQLDCVLKEKTERVTNGETDKIESIRHEIRNLRSERDRLTDMQCILNQKLKKMKRPGEYANDYRQILHFDVAKEVIDHAMEFKNQMICGRDGSDKRFFVENPCLMDQLNKLDPKEMRVLLYKCFQKIVDLRESSRQLEIQLLQFEQERSEWELREREMHHKYQQMCLKEERNNLRMQNQKEKMLTKLLQKTGEEYDLESTLTNDQLESPLATLLQQLAISNGNDFDYGRSSNHRSHRHHPVQLQNTAALATTSKRGTTTDLVDTLHKQKSKHSFLAKLLNPKVHGSATSHHGQSGSMLANHSHTNPDGGKVTRTHKKIVIEQHRS